MTLNVGVLGLGKMGKLHLMNCKFIDDVKVIAVTDASEKNLKWAKSRGINALYNDYTEMIEKENIDVVIITLPNFLHVKSGILAAEKGIDVFMEKPLANTVAEGELIVNAIKKYNTKFMIGCNCRFIDSIEQLKGMYDNGILGDVEIALLENIGNGPFSPFLEPSPVPDWYFDPQEAGGGAFLDLGYHMIDLFQYFFQDVALEYVQFGNRYNLPYEDNATAILRSNKTSTRGIVNLGWFSRSVFPKFDFRVILHGTADFASTDYFMPNIYFNAVKEGLRNVLRRMTQRKIKPLAYTYYYYSYFKELNHFFECVRDDGVPMIRPDEALKTLRVIEEGYNRTKGAEF
jgi:predicted dehydrogenase